MAQESEKSTSDLASLGEEALKTLKEKWGKLIGNFTFDDIIKELKQRGRDPRNPFKAFHFREDICEVKDLEKDMVCPGLVANVTDFGAFIDIGVQQEGLLHRSQIPRRFFGDTKQALTLGKQVQVKILEVDKEKNQMWLTLLESETSKQRPKKTSHRTKFSKGKKASREDGKKGRGQGGPSRGKPRRPSTPFNNPFEALTELKK